MRDAEEFVSSREDLGAATAHLLPAISVLVARLLRVRPAVEDRKPPTADRAEVELYRAAWRVRRRLPADVAEEDLDGFISRHRATLVQLAAGRAGSP